MISKQLNREDVLESVRNALEAVAPGYQIDMQSDVSRIGLDSMEVVSFFVELEGLFGTSLGADEIDQYELVRIDNLVSFLVRGEHE